MKKILWIASIILLCIHSCTVDSKTQDLSIIKELENLKLDSIFYLQDCTNFKWDTAYLVTPYESFNKQFSDNIPYNLAKEIKSMEMRDDACLIIFSQKNKVVKYSVIKRAIIDFSFYTNPFILPKSELRINNKRIVLIK